MIRTLKDSGNEIELKDEEEDNYQPVREEYYDDDFAYEKDGADFAAAGGFTFKGESDDDDLALPGAEDMDDSDEGLYSDDEF